MDQEDYARLIQAGHDMQAGAQTLTTWLRTWRDEYKQPRIAPSTLRFYHQLIELYMVPSIGDTRLDRVNSDQLVRFFNHLSQHLSARTVHHVYTALNQALSRAVKARKLLYNPMQALDSPSAPPKPQQAFSMTDIGQLLSSVADHRLWALYYLAIVLGLRKGEVLGLRWVDYDRATGVLRVTGQIQAEGGRACRVERTKTRHSQRCIPLPRQVQDVLQVQWDRLQHERRADTWQEHGLLFPALGGGPMHPRNLSRHWYGLLRTSGVSTTARPFHQLRHTAASNLSAAGASEAVCRAVLGHGATTITQGYTHATESDMRAALERVCATLHATLHTPQQKAPNAACV